MLTKVVDILKSSNNVSIYVHINTDCDAMGSSLALKLGFSITTSGVVPDKNIS